MVMRKMKIEKKQSEMTHKLLLLIKEIINFESIYSVKFYLLPQT